MKTLILEDDQARMLLDLLMDKRLSIRDEIARIDSYIKNQECDIDIVSASISRIRGLTQEKIDEERDKLEPEKRRVCELKVRYEYIENIIKNNKF